MQAMPRRQFLRSLSAATAGAALSRVATAARPKQPKRPNIVLIVADDLGWNNVGYHGGTARTPNLDRLVREGVELDRFYAAPLCSPTRAGLLTGRHPLRMGVGCSVITPWRTHGLPLDVSGVVRRKATHE